MPKKIESISTLKSTKNCKLFEKKTFPKFFNDKTDQFAHPRQKELTNSKQFSHVVSPIGTYMKKTATTPLMTCIRSKTNKAEVLNSTVFRELEYESRMNKMSSNNVHTTDSLYQLPGVHSCSKVLPKKAYISSNFKHVLQSN